MINRSLPIAAYGLLILFLLSPAVESGEPVGWRNRGCGHFGECKPPTSWSADTPRWKTELPATSMSSPVAVGGVVFTTVEPDQLVCIEAKDGNILWKSQHNYDQVFPEAKVREIEAQHAIAAKIKEKINVLQKELNETPAGETAARGELDAKIKGLQKQYSDATPFPPNADAGIGNSTGTPVTDGQTVWATFATGIVSAHSLDGRRLWMQFVEKPMDRYTSSPLLVDGLVVVHLNNLTALDAKTGKIRWQAKSPPRNGTPVVVRVSKQPAGEAAEVAENTNGVGKNDNAPSRELDQSNSTDLIVTPSGSVVQASDGKVLAEKLFQLAYCSPVAEEATVFAVERGATKAIRFEFQPDGELDSKVLWETRGAEDDRLASPVVHEGYLYSISGKGILEVNDAATGERVYRKRLDFGQSRVDPSLALAGGVLFASSNDGRTLAIRPGKEYDEIGRGQVEGFSSTPFFGADCTYIRTAKHLYCLAKLP